MNVPKLRFKEFNDNWRSYKLSDLVEFFKGNLLAKSDLDDNGKYPCILYGQLYTKYKEVIRIIESKTNRDEKNIPRSQKGDVLIPSSGETPIDISTSSCIQSDNVLLGGDINILRPINCDGRFLSYAINNNKKTEIARVAQGHSVVHLYIDNLKYISINVPSIKEQNKIADALELLDKKIELQSKKIEDLKLFKKGLLQKQYNYIKDKNLVELSDIANIYQPQTISQNKLDNGKYFVFGANGIIGKYSRYNHKKKQITISCRGENSGKVNITPEKCWITGNSMVLNIDNNYNVDKIYLKCVLDSQNLRYLISGSGQPQITRNVILKHKIPLLPILEQKKFRNPFIKLDLKIHLEETKVNKLLDIKKGLMQDMFA